MEKILCMDDEISILDLYKGGLKSYEVLTAPNPEAAESILRDEDLVGIITDNNMNANGCIYTRGIDAVTHLRLGIYGPRNKDAPVILATADGDGIDKEVEKLNGHYLGKPFRLSEIRELVKKAFES